MLGSKIVTARYARFRTADEVFAFVDGALSVAQSLQDFARRSPSA